MTEQQLPRAPSGLLRAGRRLWKSIVEDADSQDIELDALERSYLEDACRLADRIDQMETTLAQSETGLMVKGYQGQPVAHPLLGEIRQSRQLRALTLARIRVTPPAGKGSEAGGALLPMGVQQRDAANARWGKG
jgi:hypothetical protein